MSLMINSFFERFHFNQLFIKIVASILTLVLFQFQSIGQTTDLIISEYGEGSSNNKFVEIYNGTGAAVNLANYEIWRISNGGTWPEATIALSGMLANNDVYVVANPSSSGAILAVTDLTSGNCSWNGDDAVGLAKDIATVMTLIDAVGTDGADPGAGWNVAATTNGTADNTIIRKPTICSPNTNWTTSAGTTVANSEWTVFASDYITDLGSHTNTCDPSTVVTISAGTHTGANYDVTCDDDDTGTLTFTSVGTFNAGNIFTAQLSDDAGSFGSPTSIGTLNLNGVDPSGTINLTIPSGTASGAGYAIRIISTDPSGTSDTTSSFTVTLTGGPCTLIPPHLTGVIINSCDGACEEKDNELVFGNTGGYSVTPASGDFNFQYGTTLPATNYSNSVTTNLGTTADLNTEAACGVTFVEGTGVIIPPNSNFILASNNLCVEALTWDGLCGQGPIYIIYTDDTDWVNNPNTGIFSNSTSAGIRRFRTVIESTDGTIHTIDYEYDRTQNSNLDGDFVTYDHNGGAPLSYLNNNCQIEPTILPIEILEFTAHKNDQTSILNWITGSERNSLRFEIERFSSENEFEKIGTIYAFGNSQEAQYYNYIDENPLNGINYYRLKMIDMDGSFKYSEVRSVKFDQSTIDFFHSNDGIIKINQQIEHGSFSVYDASGRIIQSGSIESNNQFKLNQTVTGIYVISLNTGNSITTKRLFFK